MIIKSYLSFTLSPVSCKVRVQTQNQEVLSQIQNEKLVVNQPTFFFSWTLTRKDDFQNLEGTSGMISRWTFRESCGTGDLAYKFTFIQDLEVNMNLFQTKLGSLYFTNMN